MKKVMLFFALLVSASSLKAQTPSVVVSDKTGWHKIGERTVDFKMDHDEIAVLGADAFASLKFHVSEAPINLISMEIFFESGTSQAVKIGEEIKEAGDSRKIDLDGKGERRLKKIVFNYKTHSKKPLIISAAFLLELFRSQKRLFLSKNLRKTRFSNKSNSIYLHPSNTDHILL